MWYQTAKLFKLPRALRILNMAFIYVIFMSSSLIVGFSIFGLIRIVIPNQEKRSRAFTKIVQMMWMQFLKLLQFCQIYESIEVNGIEKLKHLDSPLLVSNHVSLIDIVALGAHIPHFNCVVKASLYNQPFFGAIVRACKFIPNSGAEEFIVSCRESFDSKRPLVIFPQGTRTSPNEKLKFKRGAANIIARIEDITVVPVTIEANPPIFTKELKWYEVPKELPRLSISIGDPLDFHEDISDEVVITKRVQLINRFLEKLYR